MKTTIVITKLILISFFLPLVTSAQNEEQKAWLINKAAEQVNIIPLNASSTIIPSLLKSTENEIEIDHGESAEAGGSYSESGGAYRTPNNVTAKAIIHASNVNIGIPTSLQLTGQGITTLLFDNKRPMNGHEAFDQRVFVPLQNFIWYNPTTGKCETVYSGIPPCNLHPTVASSIMLSGSGNDARGTAPNATMIAYDWDFAEYYLAENAANGANLACLPYGYVAGWTYSNSAWWWFGKKGQQESYLFGFYSTISKKWDDILHHAPYLLVVKSAGNDNTEGNDITSGTDYFVWDNDLQDWITLTFNNDIIYDGYNGTHTISDIAVSKNVLTVGGINDDGSVMTISSRGPTDDLRIKPDLVANGTGISAAYYLDKDLYFSSPDGTSFAAASVAGGSALLLEQQKKLYGKTKLLSSTLKALLIHTADEKPPAGPDCTYGWGVANITAASELIEDNYQNHRQIHEFNFTSDEQLVMFKVKKISTTSSMKVTICWNDPAGTPPPISDSTNKMLVNDIDLRIIRSDNQVFLPWKLNPANPTGPAIKGDNDVDNVEQIIVNDGLTGNYDIKIYPKSGHLSDNQVVSVIISGIDANAFQSDVTLNNLTITDARAEESQNAITCNNVKVGQSGNLSLVAGNKIVLNTGFIVQAGGKFRTMYPNDFYSAFERVYPSIVFQNNLVWEDRDAILKSSKLFENANETVQVLKSLENTVNTYPNPGTGKFILELSNPDNIQTIEIYDVLGRIYYRKNCCFETFEKVDITRYSDGLYLIKVQSGNKTFIMKQIKKQ